MLPLGCRSDLVGVAMTPEQQIIVACWERHELAADTDISMKRLVELVTAETGADTDAIVGALMAGLEAGSAQ